MYGDKPMKDFFEKIYKELIDGINEFNSKDLDYRAEIPKEIEIDYLDATGSRIKFTVHLNSSIYYRIAKAKAENYINDNIGTERSRKKQ